MFHQVVFAAIMFTNVFRTTYILRSSPYAQRMPVRGKQTATRLFGLGAATFIFGFLVWNLDNIFCNNLTRWKHSLGWPGAFLLEGHSWWHIFTVSSTPVRLHEPLNETLRSLFFRQQAPISCSLATPVSRILPHPAFT